MWRRTANFLRMQLSDSCVRQTLSASLEGVAPGLVEIALTPGSAVSQQHGFAHAGAVAAAEQRPHAHLDGTLGTRQQRHAGDPGERAGAQQAAALLPDSHVVGAFHHLSARLLEDLSRPTLDGDVMVVGDVREATDTVQALAGRLPGMRGVYAGRLRNARQVEALTINLVSVNRRYKAHAGIRVTDV